MLLLLAVSCQMTVYTKLLTPSGMAASACLRSMPGLQASYAGAAPKVTNGLHHRPGSATASGARSARSRDAALPRLRKCTCWPPIAVENACRTPMKRARVCCAGSAAVDTTGWPHLQISKVEHGARSAPVRNVRTIPLTRWTRLLASVAGAAPLTSTSTSRRSSNGNAHGAIPGQRHRWRCWRAAGARLASIWTNAYRLRPGVSIWPLPYALDPAQQRPRILTSAAPPP